MSDTATFCSICGTPVLSSPPAEAETPSESTTADLVEPYYEPAPMTSGPTPATKPADLSTLIADRKVRIAIVSSIALLVLWAAIMILTGRGFTIAAVVLALAGFGTMIACLYVASLVMGYKMTVVQILATSFVCSVVGAVMGAVIAAISGGDVAGAALLGLVAWIVMIGVLITCISYFTGAELLDAVGIFVVYVVLSFVVRMVLVSMLGLSGGVLR